MARCPCLLPDAYWGGSCVFSWGALPPLPRGLFSVCSQTIVDADFLYAMHAAARSTFVAMGAEADYFWTGLIATGGYDPTIYVDDPTSRGSREAVLSELQAVASSSEWAAENAYVSAPADPVPPDYLLNWHLVQLANTTTSDGRPVAMPLATPPPSSSRVQWPWPGLRATAAAKSTSSRDAPPHGAPHALLVLDRCNFTPAVPPRAAPAMEGTCDVCAASRHLFWELALASAAALVMAVGAIIYCCCCGRRRSGQAHGGPSAWPLVTLSRMLQDGLGRAFPMTRGWWPQAWLDAADARRGAEGDERATPLLRAVHGPAAVATASGAGGAQ